VAGNLLANSLLFQLDYLLLHLFVSLAGTVTQTTIR